MATQDVLSAKLEVKDSFTSKLNSFIKTVNSADQAFNKFINSADLSARTLEKTFDVIDKKVSSVTTKIIAQTDSMTNKIVNSSNKVEQTQNKTISNLTSKYGKMGKDVQDIFKVINKDAEGLAKSGLNIKFGNGKGNSNNNGDNNEQNILGGIFNGDKTESLLSGILSGSFTRVLGTLSVIGAGITGVKKVLDTIDGWMQQGYNILNTLSTGLFSISGLEKNVEDAGQLETSRVALNTLYGSKSLGQQYYKIGVDTAQSSSFAESDIIALQKKLAGAKIDYANNPKALQTILGLAALKPEMGVEHVGFSIVK